MSTYNILVGNKMEKTRHVHVIVHVYMYRVLFYMSIFLVEKSNKTYVHNFHFLHTLLYYT